MTIEEKINSITDEEARKSAAEKEGNPWNLLENGEPNQYMRVQLLLKNPLYGCHLGACYFRPKYHTEPNCIVDGTLYPEGTWVESRFLHFSKNNILAWRKA